MSYSNIFKPLNLQQASHLTYQLLLDGKNSVPSSLTVCFLACDNNCLRVAVLCWEINFGVAFFTDLPKKETKKSLRSVHVRKKPLDVVFDITTEQERAASGVWLQAVTKMSTRDNKDISPS